MDDWFIASADFDTLFGYVSEFVGFGLGLGCVVFVLGYVMWFVIDLVR